MKFSLIWLFVLTLLIAIVLAVFQLSPIAGALMGAVLLVNFAAAFCRIKLRLKFSKTLWLIFALSVSGTMLFFGISSLIVPMAPIGFVSKAIGSSVWVFAGLIFGLMISPMMLGLYCFLVPFLDTYVEWQDQRKADAPLKKSVEFFDD